MFSYLLEFCSPQFLLFYLKLLRHLQLVKDGSLVRSQVCWLETVLFRNKYLNLTKAFLFQVFRRLSKLQRSTL